MEGLEISNIPSPLLARILLQLHTLPPKENIELVNILAAGLQKYGNTSNINAFLDYCSSLAQQNDESATPWLWKHYEINNDLDWDLANSKKPHQLVGLRFLLASETARRKVQLTRYGRNTVLDPKCVHLYQDRILPVDQLLNDTLEYLKQEKGQVDKIVEELIELRLEQYSRDKFKFQQESNELDNTTYHLMGALMVRYDSTATIDYSPRSWCLYLRDYVESADGSTWRILYEDVDNKVSSDQALADIRGMPDEISSLLPSEFSQDYRPVYLFYINQDTLVPPQEEHITLDDYTFDDEYEYSDEQVPVDPPEEEESCMHCGIKDIVNDVNDMFFCEHCNRGVHQLCENPPILAFEKIVDPWYCRTCSAINGVPIPVPPPPSTSVPLDENNAPSSPTTPASIPIKRKREDNDTTSILEHDENNNTIKEI